MRVRNGDKLPYLRKVDPSVRMYQRGSPWTDFREILYFGGVGVLHALMTVCREKSNFGYNLTKTSGMLHEELCTFATWTPLYLNAQLFFCSQ